MNEKKRMQCPHCEHVGEAIWLGFGNDWLICESCSNRIQWEEVRRSFLMADEDEWSETSDLVPTYN